MIVKLISYNLAWMVVLVVPMAVLVASLMAFGGMSQRNEIAVMKASGISTYRMILPTFLASIVIAYLLVQFNNHVYPNANHAAKNLMIDISNKKPTLSLVPGVFSTEVDNYAILARKIDQKTNLLEDITLYDYSDRKSLNIVTAKKGKIYFASDQEKLILDMQNGEIHSTDNFDENLYRKIVFENHKIAMPASQFTFKQSNVGTSRSERELGAPKMQLIVDSLSGVKKRYIKIHDDFLAGSFNIDTVRSRLTSETTSSGSRRIFLQIENKMRNDKNNILSGIRRLVRNQAEINKYKVEIHKKYSLPVACIVFILIGAPLGTMTRKGGFGMAAGISLIFFTIYWAFLISGEKLADRGLFSPFWGMWSANFILGALGVYLTYKTARERVTLNFDFLKKLLPKNFRNIQRNNENY